MSDLPEAFYPPTRDGGHEPTHAAQSLWDTDAQHGGPPAALLAHALDASAAPGMRLARISVDFLGPPPAPHRGHRTAARPPRPPRPSRNDH